MRRWAKLWFEILLVVVVAGFHIYAAVAPANNMMAWYSTDDAFYYFKVAQNISEGYGSTFDRISQTNGYHPLWLLVCIPVFALARYDLVLPLRVLILVMAAFNAGTAILLYRMLRKFISTEVSMLVAAFWVLSPAVHGTTVEMGVESGINAFTLMLLAYLVASWEQKRMAGPFRYSSFLWMSAAGVLALFSRLDNVFLVLLTGLWVALRAWNLKPAKSGGQSPWRHRFLAALSYFAPLGAALAAYMLINYLAFGTPSPVSGQIKRWWGELPNTVYGFPVTNFWIYLSHWITRNSDLGPWSMFFSGFHSVADSIEKLFGVIPNDESMQYKTLHRLIVLGTGLIFAGASGLILKTNWQMIKRNFIRLPVLPFFLGCAVQITSYKITPYVGSRGWYWVSEIVVLFLVGALLVEGFFCLLKRWRLPDRGLQIITLVAVLLLLARFENMMTVMVPWKEDLKWKDAYLWGAQGLEQATEPGSVIGTPGGGSLGYFTKDRTIVNLDGLINSYEYYLLLRAGKASSYYDRIGLDYAYGNKYMLAESDPYWMGFKNRIVYIDKIVGTNLFQYLPSGTN